MRERVHMPRQTENVSSIVKSFIDADFATYNSSFFLKCTANFHKWIAKRLMVAVDVFFSALLLLFISIFCLMCVYICAVAKLPINNETCVPDIKRHEQNYGGILFERRKKKQQRKKKCDTIVLRALIRYFAIKLFTEF